MKKIAILFAVGFLEFKFRVSCNQCVPFRLLVPLGKEQA